MCRSLNFLDSLWEVKLTQLYKVIFYLHLKNFKGLCPGILLFVLNLLPLPLQGFYTLFFFFFLQKRYPPPKANQCSGSLCWILLHERTRAGSRTQEEWKRAREGWTFGPRYCLCQLSPKSQVWQRDHSCRLYWAGWTWTKKCGARNGSQALPTPTFISEYHLRLRVDSFETLGTAPHSQWLWDWISCRLWGGGWLGII